MPQLVVFGRRWDVGSDDLYIPALIEALANGTWMAILGTVYFRNSHTVHFVEGSHVKYFYVGGMVMSSVNLVLLWSIAHCSLKGTVINTWPRRHMAHLLWLKMAFGVLTLFYAIPCTKWTFFTPHPADDIETAPVATMRHAVFALWSAIGLSAFCWRKAFQRLHEFVQEKVQKKNQNFERVEGLKSVAAHNWKRRIQNVADMVHLHGHPEIESVANLLEHVFKSKPIDTVTTDTLAALILLDKDQESRLSKLRQMTYDLTDSANQGPDSLRPQSWMNERNCAHYAKYAAGVYGWPYYVMESPIATWGLIKVLIRSRYIPRKLPWNIIGDNSFLLHTTVFKIITGLSDRDIIYACYHNKLFEIPFVVSVDHVQQAVVVTIRGTLSLEDVFVDLVAFESEEIPIPGQKDIRVHQGMFITAQNIQAKLLGTDKKNHDADSKGILDRAWSFLEDEVGSDRAKDYHLVITGQSLGAGTAAILALLMKQIPRYSNLQCYAFSPPGGLMRLAAARYCEDFVCSVILGDDIVGRMSLPSLYDFRTRLLQQVKDCDIPKHKIYGGWLQGLVGKLLGEKVPACKLGARAPSWSGNPEATLQVLNWQREIEAAIENNERDKAEWVNLYPPGCVMFIKETPAPSYTMERGDSPLFSEIVISSSMIRHHTPYMVLRSLIALCNHKPHSS